MYIDRCPGALCRLIRTDGSQRKAQVLGVDRTMANSHRLLVFPAGRAPDFETFQLIDNDFQREHQTRNKRKEKKRRIRKRIPALVIRFNFTTNTTGMENSSCPDWGRARAPASRPPAPFYGQRLCSASQSLDQQRRSWTRWNRYTRQSWCRSIGKLTKDS